jgi:hypothetical protein
MENKLFQHNKMLQDQKSALIFWVLELADHVAELLAQI